MCELEKEQNMVLWIDKEAEKRARECAYPIRMPEVLMQTEWDAILIAVKSENTAVQIMDELAGTYHIEQTRICWSRVEHIPIWDIY